ncbi:MAG: O-antigen ligase family protein [Planctomycetota bacterium]
MFSNPSMTGFDQAEPQPAGFVSHGLRSLSLITASITVAITPWLLGGAIPHARACLQIGAIVSSVLALLGMLIDRKPQAGFPVICLPILGLALIGGMQLLPRYAHVATQMDHAVVSEAAEFLPRELSTPTHPQTSSPSETRRAISQLLSLALLVFVVYESVRTARHLTIALSILTTSGVFMAALALSQQFGSKEVVIGNHWKISNTTPFGCFVNPNNAAGWLSVCLACSLFLCGVASFRPEESRNSIRQSRRWASVTERFWLWWADLLGAVSSMSSLQIITLSGTIILIAAISATLSRAGIVAGCLGVAAFALTRLRSGYWTTTILLVAALVILAGGLMLLFELDTIVLSELRTLKDPVSESTGRLLHWSDSLQSCFDFPILGSGLGAYRFGTLPYQRHFTGKWFQRADNQYVELIVESGFLGAACLVFFAILTLQMLVRQFRSERNQKKTRNLYYRRWLGSASACAMVAIAGASFFDYGISLPSVSGATILLLSCLSAAESTNLTSPESPLSSTEGVVAGSFRLIAVRVVLWICVAGVSASLIQDAVGSVHAYESVPDVERLLDRPDMKTLTESGDQLLSGLESHVTRQHDDPEYQRRWILLCALLHQRDLVHQICRQQNQPLSFDQQTNLLSRVTPTALLLQITTPETPQQIKEQSLTEIRQTLKQKDWFDAARKCLHRHPLMLSIAPNVSLYGLLLRDEAIVREFTQLARFSEPHAAQNLFVLGYFLTRAGWTGEGSELWQQALRASETVRGAILMEVSGRTGIDSALQHFAPTTWESAASAALQCRVNPPLQQQLFELAESRWQPGRKMTAARMQLRANQLIGMNKPDVAAEFLNEQLASDPTNIEIRKFLARILETSGENEQAYNEWLRIRSLAGDSEETEKALKRLIRLPPKPAGTKN